VVTLFCSKSTLCSQLVTHPKTLIETLPLVEQKLDRRCVSTFDISPKMRQIRNKGWAEVGQRVCVCEHSTSARTNLLETETQNRFDGCPPSRLRPLYDCPKPTSSASSYI
jgi:hypothetical protein